MTEIVAPIEFLYEKYQANTSEDKSGDDIKWLMGQVHHQAIGNVAMAALRQQIETIIK